MLLKNKTAIIYGAGGSLGSTIAQTFSREGAYIFVTGRSEASIKKVAGQIIANGGKASYAVVDALDEKAVNDHINEVVETNIGAAEQMAVESNEVTQAVENIASVSEENSAAVEEVSASAEEMSAQMEEVTFSAQALSEMAQRLQEIIAQFRLPNGETRLPTPHPMIVPVLAKVTNGHIRQFQP